MAMEEDSVIDVYSCPVCSHLHGNFEDALICWEDCHSEDNTTMTLYLWTEFPFQMEEFTMMMKQARAIRGRVESYTTWGSVNFMLRTSVVVEYN